MGDMASTRCMLLRTRCTKKLFMLIFVMGSPSACIRGRTALAIVSRSSTFHRLGTSPLLRMLFTSSRKDSFTICVSVKRKVVLLPSAPASSSTRFRSSRHSTLPYPLATSIWNSSKSSKYVASRVSD
jgi:hypothetical protein